MHRSFNGLAARAALIGLLVSTGLAAIYSGCGGDSSTQSTATASGSGGSAATSTASSTGGGSSTATSTSTASSSTSSSTATGSGGSGGSSTSSGAGGSGGAGGGPGWPTCDTQPAGSPTKTLHEIWQDNPAQPTEVWVPGVFVTAVSKAGCTAGVACQIYVQQQEQFADLAAGSQQAMKIFISANTATHFVGIKQGDKVDVYAHAWRYNVNGENELLLQVSLALPGCAKMVGSGNPLPVTAKLSDLTLSAYEDTVGPLLVQVSKVSGKPQTPPETFGLWDTGTFSDAGPESVVSLSPYFLPGGVFTGFDVANQGKTHDFGSVTGVFGLFIPTGSMTKYKEIYPRAESEYPIVKVH